MNEIKNENVEVIEAEETAEEQVKESKVKNFVSKVGGGIKKHWKKAAGVAVGGALLVVGYALGAKNGGASADCDDGECIDFEELETPEVSDEETVE